MEKYLISKQSLENLIEIVFREGRLTGLVNNEFPVQTLSDIKDRQLSQLEYFKQK